jgi:hypothetical protein
MAFTQPNLYVLSGGGISITYSTTAIDGKPHFTYHSSALTRTFTGDEIKSEPSEFLGTLVSVVIQLTPDSGSTSFTLLIPRINLNAGEVVNVTTEGITTHHRFSLFPPAMHGQLDTYAAHRMSGTAQFVRF